MAQYVLDRSLPVKNPAGATWPIKSGVSVDEGDPVALDSNAQVVLGDANGIPAIGFAVFTDMGDKATRTGVAGLTVKCSIFRRAQVVNAKGGTAMTKGANQYLSETAGNITATEPTGTGFPPQCLGIALSASVLDGFANPPAGVAAGGAGYVAGDGIIISGTDISVDPAIFGDIADLESFTLELQQYIDVVAAGLTPKLPVRLATAAALPACTYDNGAAGVGATLTADAVGTLTVDSVLTALGNRILVKDQVDGTQNGVYEVTTEGEAGVAFILTRATDSDTGAEIFNAIYAVSLGTVNTGRLYNTSNAIEPTMGTDDITFAQFTVVSGGGKGGIQVSAPISKAGNTLGLKNIATLTAKTTPVDADLAIIHDSAAPTAAPKKVTWANVKATLKTYFDALYQVLDADLTAIAGLTSAADKIPYFTGAGTADLLERDTDGALAANSDTRLATQKAVKTYVDGIVAAQDAMVFQGVIDCSTDPDYPAADRGDTYRVSVAGQIGGGAGPNVEVGDILICLTDGTLTGDHAAVGASWGIIQVNIDGSLTTADIGVSVQAYDAELAALAGLTSAADKVPYFTGSGAAALADLSAFARSFLDDGDEATLKATLNMEAGVDYASLAQAKAEALVIPVSDETTDLTTGAAKVTFRMPWAMTLTEVRASVTTAPTGAAIIVGINESGSTILSTDLSIDATEKTSVTAATPAVISDAALADDAEITIDIDQIGSTVAGAGLKVTLIGTRA